MFFFNAFDFYRFVLPKKGFFVETSKQKIRRKNLNKNLREEKENIFDVGDLGSHEAFR